MAKTYWLKFGTQSPAAYTGLSPSMIQFIKADGTTLAGPGITEIISGTGAYQFTWNPTFPIFFTVDGGATLTDTSIRYITGSLDPIQAVNEQVTNQGSTLVAIGNTSIALGTTTIAFGTTLVAIGTTTIALGTTSIATTQAVGTTVIAMGSTLVAIGNTAIGFGTTVLAQLTNEGVTLVAIGNTLAAIGAINASLTVSIAGIGSTASSFGDSTTDPGTLFGYMKRIQENLEGNNSFFKYTGVLDIYSRGSTTLLAAKTIANSVSMVVKS